MKSAGRPNEPATREGVAMLIDRQLPGGGFNYGNTYVLGQLVRAHTEPTLDRALEAGRERSLVAVRSREDDVAALDVGLDLGVSERLHHVAQRRHSDAIAPPEVDPAQESHVGRHRRRPYL